MKNRTLRMPALVFAFSAAVASGPLKADDDVCLGLDRQVLPEILQAEDLVTDGYYYEGLRTLSHIANKGCFRAMRTMADVFNGDRGPFPGKDPKVAIEWKEKAAKMGDPVAQKDLVELYKNGDRSNKIDPSLGKAIYYLKMLANDGDIPAMKQLSSIYSAGGKGVSKDRAGAELWKGRAEDAQRKENALKEMEKNARKKPRF